MNLNEYQARAATTADYRDVGENIEYVALGLAGEAGEFANQVKKIDRDDRGEITPERKKKLKDELGDVLWYVAMAAHEIGMTLDVIAEHNLFKLAVRKNEDLIHGDDR